MLTSNFKSVALLSLSVFCLQLPVLASSAVDQTNEEQGYHDEEYYFCKKAAGLADIADRTKYDSMQALSLHQKELYKYIELHLLEVETSFETIRDCPTGKLITQVIAEQKVSTIDQLHDLFIDHLGSLLIQHELISNRLTMLTQMDEDLKQRMSNSLEEKELLAPLTVRLDALCQRGQGMANTVEEIAKWVYAYTQVW